MASSGMTKSRNTPKGFTLLELLICIAVIGIVMAISVPNVSSWTKTRIVKKELASLESLIDYSKVTSMNKSRKLLLELSSPNTIQIFQLKNNTVTLEEENLNTTSCSVNTNYEPVTEYPTAINFESTLKAKHTNTAAAGTVGSYPNTASIMCFFADGTTTAGGFELEKDCYEYRIDVWLTGFYSKQVNTNSKCSGVDTWIERN